MVSWQLFISYAASIYIQTPVYTTSSPLKSNGVTKKVGHPDGDIEVIVVAMHMQWKLEALRMCDMNGRDKLFRGLVTQACIYGLT
jgi:hypothetical protein